MSCKRKASKNAPPLETKTKKTNDEGQTQENKLTERSKKQHEKYTKGEKAWENAMKE